MGKTITVHSIWRIFDQPSSTLTSKIWDSAIASLLGPTIELELTTSRSDLNALWRIPCSLTQESSIWPESNPTSPR
ncbi:hypothetical protein ACS0TY_013757 [Phlomoides rotata]